MKMQSTSKKVTPQGEVCTTQKLTTKEKVAKLVDGPYISSIMAVLTVFALFGDDMRLLAFTQESDPAFDAISFIAVIAFTIEFGMNVYSKPDYACGFYFILDLVSTVSLIPDVGFIWEPLTGSGSDDSAQAATLKAGRASRAGTKASRIVRIVRLVRMVRIVRLYKIKANQEELNSTNISEPSKVGKMLTELTTRRLIILVVTMVIVLPFIDGTLDEDYNEFQEFGLDTLHHYGQDYNTSGTVDLDVMRSMVTMYARNAGILLALKLTQIPVETTNKWLQEMKFQSVDDEGNWVDSSAYTKTTHPVTNWHHNMMMENVGDYLRSSEYTKLESIGCYDDNSICEDCDTTENACYSYAFFDSTAASTLSAGINMLKTMFIMIILAVGAIMFTRDAQTLVIGPIERMMELVNKLAENPLASTKTEKKVYEEDEPQGDYETVMLEETLSKIGGLLQVGFGVAGTEIIAKNMGGAGELNVMIPGKKITSIFGFGIIEGFTEMCSVLEENIIMYINTIADIVHSDANSYYGAANKNIGSAFLLAWKICDGPLPGLRDPRDSGKDDMDDATKARQRASINMECQGEGKKSRAIAPQEMVDSALTAVLKMRIDIHNANARPSGIFRQFCDNPQVVSTYGPNFEVHLGFGMHIGWAIEGAIGSRFKIDASFLSSNVNLSARLEAATGQFNIPMLLSGWFVHELSPAARKLCRKVDCVTVKGSAIPMELWTFDIGNYPEKGLIPEIDAEGCQIPVNYATDKRFLALRDGIDPSFFEHFEQGVEHYLSGNWPAAKESLEQCKLVHKNDGPTDLLLRVLNANNNAAPESWPGYRELTEK